MKNYKFTREELLDTPVSFKGFEEDLNEDLTSTFKKELAKRADDHIIHELDDISDLDAMLTKVLKQNIKQMRDLKPGKKYLPLNILIIGPAGTGKSSIVHHWIQSQEIKGRKLRGVTFNGSQLNQDLVQGVGHAVHKTDAETGEDTDYADYLNFKVFDKLDPNDPSIYGSILFIDELNRSYTDARAALLDMITSHETADNNSPTNRKTLNKWIMTVAAVNPPDSAHAGADLLDLAMLTRFYIFDWKSSVKGTRKYLLNELKDNLEQAEENLKTGESPNGFPYDEDDYREDVETFKGQMDLVKRVMTPDLAYDSGDTLTQNQKAQKAVLNSRTLEEVIRLSDGTPEDFLRLLPGACGISTDSPLYQKFKLALDPKAADTDSGFISKTKSAAEALQEFEDEL